MGLTMNLISGTHHLCERRKYVFMVLRKYTIIFHINLYKCGVTICSPNLEVLGYKPNEPNTINLYRVGERTGLLMDFLAVNQDFKSVRAGKDASI